MNSGRDAVALNTYRDNAIAAEAEILSLMRIDLALESSLPGSYQGRWVWYPSLEHFQCNVEVLIPEDIREYQEWVARGALTFIQNYPSDFRKLQDQLAHMAAGGATSYPELSLPARLTQGDTTTLREVVEQILGTETPSLIEALHATEMILHNFKTQLRALCLEVVNAASGRPGQTVEPQTTTVAIRNTPDEIDDLMASMGRMYLAE